MTATGLSLCCRNAGEALSLFRQRQLSPVPLLRAQIARLEAVKPKVNARQPEAAGEPPI